MAIVSLTTSAFSFFSSALSSSFPPKASIVGRGRRRSCAIWEGAVLGRQLEISGGSFFIEAGIKGARLEMKGESVYRGSPIPGNGNAKGCDEIGLTRKIA